MKLRKLALAPIAAAAMMAFSLNASAATESWILNVASTGSQGTGPWATVTATEINANSIGVTVNLISPPTIGFVTTGGPHHAFAFNLASDATPAIAGSITPGFVDAGSGINTPFGFFSHTIDWTGGPGGSTPSPGPLDFTIFDAGGITLASFIPSTGAETGYRFSADLLVSGVDGIPVTGNVAVGVPTAPVPEPETYAMMLAGLGLLGFVARRRRQNFGNVLPA